MRSNYYLYTFVLLFISCTPQENKQSDAITKHAFLEKNMIHLGEIPNSKTQIIQISINNPSSTKIKVIDISKSCGCMNLNIKNLVIKPKSNRSFTISYNPKDDSGKINRSIMLRMSNDDFLVFKFDAVVTQKKRPLIKMKGLSKSIVQPLESITQC
jgi:hypothetical protein